MDFRSICRLKYTEEGLKAVLRLGGGDMRRVLNILQATSMAHDTVEEEHVYACTGNPLPSEIQSAVHSLLNDPFSKCHKSTSSCLVHVHGNPELRY